MNARASHIGVVQFSSVVQSELALSSDAARVRNRIQAMSQLGAGTYLGEGIVAARRQLADRGRPDVPDVMVVLTDGMSSDDAATPAARARAAGTRIFAVGVGTLANRAELRAIASPAKAAHVLRVDDFSGLSTIRRTILQRSCIPTGGVSAGGTSSRSATGHGPDDDRPTARIEIPSLDIRAPLVPAGLTRAGRLMVPTRAHIAGWWSAGAVPAEPGSAVVVGHVDANGKPGVFARLSRIRRGSTVFVKRGHHARRFGVTGTRSFPKRDLPTDRVYGTTTGRAGLRVRTLVCLIDGRWSPMASANVALRLQAGLALWKSRRLSAGWIRLPLKQLAPRSISV